MRPRISIIVPCYNGEKYIRETLDCLQKQTIDDWECIIVNDGSTDNSLEILKEYAAKDSRYKYIDKENGGPAIARNTAIAASSGKYILPLDADDLIAPFYAEKAIDYLETHSNCKVVYGIAYFFGDLTGEWVLSEYNYEKELWKNSIYCSAVYRKTDYDRTKGYNPNMRFGNEDWDFWLSLLSENDEVYKIPEKVFFYRKHGVSHSTDLFDNVKASNTQMVLNHIDRYSPYFHELFTLRKMNEYKENELNKLLKSKKYKLGKFLLAPFLFLKNK